jgi:hypothetical protein
MTKDSNDWEILRSELAQERAELFRRFTLNPSNTLLAIEIKRLDDRISDCSENMQRAARHQFIKPGVLVR